ncbi:inovirus Gp2 family protein [Vogesella sp. AC12]|uniref:inovirus Gp2 family protein n=1 Tax=Vogesella sp. AC12 TaxID=2950550 RepID=UPI002108A01F|nr:inovirus Gp2 family protein [Vogesella sp. AC12]MCQ4143345.1 inovirus Gp2 family protein [Vogesella sp. AC12]
MKRHPQNTKLHYWDQPTYNDWPINLNRGPLITEYLDSLADVVDTALRNYPRVFAFRVDLRFPTDFCLDCEAYTNEVLKGFVGSLTAQIRHNRMLAKRVRDTAAETVVRYVWAREQVDSEHPHWHLVILLNWDAYRCIGQYRLGNANMYNRVIKAWASALRREVGEVAGLVHFPANAAYQLQRDDDESIAEFFYRASYLCKAATKHYGDGQHAFGASRR